MCACLVMSAAQILGSVRPSIFQTLRQNYLSPHTDLRLRMRMIMHMHVRDGLCIGLGMPMYFTQPQY